MSETNKKYLLNNDDIIKIFNEKLDYMIERNFYWGEESKLITSMKLSFKNKIMKNLNELMGNIDFSNNLFLIKNKSIDLLEHSMNTCLCSSIMSNFLKYSEEDVKTIMAGAFLHDIGKIFEEQISLEDDLDDTGHVEKGFEHIKNFSEIEPIISRLILEHHEKVDGTGEPRKITGEKIHYLSKVLAVCNTYDNLIARSYSKGKNSPSDAVEYILGSAGAVFDYDVVKFFFKKIIPYPVGSLVRLSDSRIGVVSSIPKDFPFRPNVRVVKQLATTVSMEDISLLDSPSLIITTILEEVPNPSVQSYLKHGFN